MRLMDSPSVPKRSQSISRRRLREVSRYVTGATATSLQTSRCKYVTWRRGKEQGQGTRMEKCHSPPDQKRTKDDRVAFKKTLSLETAESSSSQSEHTVVAVL